MAIYLYCRISQRKQNIERQKRNLKEVFPDGTIVEEAYTGTTTARPAWTRIFKKAAPGDTIAFDSVSRMSRNAEEGIEVYEELYSRGVNLVFLKEPHINTETYKASLSQSIPMTGGDVDFILEGVNRYLIALAKKLGADLVTTAKDFVKIPNELKPNFKVLEIEIRWKDEGALREFLEKRI